VVGDIERVLGALNSAGVRYLIVGGVAVVLHGHLRTTADLDLVVQLERDNVLKAVRALTALGYRPRAPVAAEAFADEEVRESWVRDKDLRVFSLWSAGAPTLEVDLFAREPFPFADVHARALEVPLENTVAWVVSLPDLIALKSKTGRPQDLQDIEALRALEAGDAGEDGR
jgi:hypothetical protein